MTLAKRLYRASPIKRSRRTKAAVAKIRDAIMAAMKDEHPMTVRQVFYQLVVRDVIEKTEADYQRTVIRLMTEMRLDGTLPFDWVVDESRRVRVTQTFDNLTDAIEHTARFYRRSALKQSDDYVEIWLEKDALAGVLWDVTSDYDVSVDGIARDAKPDLPARQRAGDPAGRSLRQADLHLSIWRPRPSGVLIPQTIERRLAQMCGQLRCPPPIVERSALTEEQIEEFELPTRPTKRRGNPHAHKFKGHSVEIDALPPSELRAMVTKVIERHVSPEATAALRVAEDSERELLRAWRPGRCPPTRRGSNDRHAPRGDCIGAAPRDFGYP